MNQERKPLSLTRKVQLSLFTLLALTIVILFLGEAVMHLRRKAPYDNKDHDKILGWKTRGGYHAHVDAFKNKSHGTYTLDVHFASNGFRMWNQNSYDSVSETIFFIGDSYTESLECSDNALYYAFVRDNLPCHVYAYGTSGYGTTQEYLILQHYLDSVKPTRVVLQVCNNDFIDNDWELENHSNYIVGQRRPYLLNSGEITYHHPRPWFGQIKEYSLFLDYIFVHAYTFAPYLHLTERDKSLDEIAADSASFNFKNTIALTENALVKIKNLVNEHGATLYVFDADCFKPGQNLFPELCARNNIAYIRGVGEEVYSHELKGENVRAYDGYHWNSLGEEIVGRYLVSYFQQNVFAH